MQEWDGSRVRAGAVADGGWLWWLGQGRDVIWVGEFRGERTSTLFRQDTHISFHSSHDHVFSFKN